MSTSATQNRILFPGNPWPNGHAIKDFAWSGRLDPNSGIWFHFHLETENYYADDVNPEPDCQNKKSEGGWDSKIVWRNYHSCTMSSTHWGAGSGFQVASKEEPIDFAALTDREFRADPLPVEFLDHFPWVDDNQRRAFNLYLLGHDLCADHTIRFPGRLGADSFAIEWRGRIALASWADRVFRYTFSAPDIRAQFGGIFLPKGTARSKARTLLWPFVVDPRSWHLVEEADRLVFKLA